MPTVEDRLKTLETQMRIALAAAAAIQGQPASSIISIPHNDSWLFEDNVDSTHAANLRYVISGNVQRVVSARLTLHLAPYRTYNSLSLTTTGADSNGHTHAEAAHAHQMFAFSANVGDQTAFSTWTPGSGQNATLGQSGVGGNTMTSSNGNGAGTGGESATHTHTVSGSAVLGVTEGATATGVTISFDGADKTAALGGPFNADVIELNVMPYLPVAIGSLHTIAMLPSGLGRIEAHLRLGVYVSAGSIF